MHPILPLIRFLILAACGVALSACATLETGSAAITATTTQTTTIRYPASTTTAETTTVRY
jgi:hypothetical protein